LETEGQSAQIDMKREDLMLLEIEMTEDPDLLLAITTDGREEIVGPETDLQETRDLSTQDTTKLNDLVASVIREITVTTEISDPTSKEEDHQWATLQEEETEMTSEVLQEITCATVAEMEESQEKTSDQEVVIAQDTAEVVHHVNTDHVLTAVMVADLQ